MKEAERVVFNRGWEGGGGEGGGRERGGGNRRVICELAFRLVP